jgi:hypothetical protein
VEWVQVPQQEEVEEEFGAAAGVEPNNGLE